MSTIFLLISGIEVTYYNLFCYFRKKHEFNHCLLLLAEHDGMDRAPQKGT